MNILKAVSSFGSLTLISRVLGYFRDILIAIFLGTSSLADVFFVAFRLPNTFRRLFAEGTFNAAFVPIYTKLNLKKNDEIYLSKYSGWYSVSDEAFYNDDEIEEMDGKKIAKDSKSVVEWMDEESYFFRFILIGASWSINCKCDG